MIVVVIFVLVHALIVILEVIRLGGERAGFNAPSSDSMVMLLLAYTEVRSSPSRIVLVRDMRVFRVWGARAGGLVRMSILIVIAVAI